MPKKSKKNNKKFEPKEKGQINVVWRKYKDQKLYYYRYEGKNYEKDEIREFAQKISDRLKRYSPESAIFEVVLKYEGNIFLSGHITRPGDPVNLWEPYDRLDDREEIIGFDLIVSIPKNKQQKVLFQ